MDLSLVFFAGLVATLAGTCLAAVLLRGDEPIGAARLLTALGLAVAITSVAAIAASVLVGSLFFAVTCAWATLVVATPLAALLTLLRARRRCTKLVRVAAGLGCVGLPCLGVYGTFVEPARLVEERHEIALSPRVALAEPLRMAVLADIQSRDVDERLRDAMRKTMAFEPHLIVLPGDLIQLEDADEYERVVPRFRELLAPLHAPLGVYFVIGNTDSAQRVRRVFEGTQVELLDDREVEREFAGQRVVIGGAGFAFLSQRTRGFLERFEQRDANELRVLVAHYPDVALLLRRPAGVDLLVAGHTHGGQVQLPLFGPPVTLSSVPRAVAAGGYHELDSVPIWVSRGIGAERGAAPQLRLLCAPEVSLLTLRSSAVAR